MFIWGEKNEKQHKVFTENYFQNIQIVFKSLLVGIAVGGVVVLYRITLNHASVVAVSAYVVADLLKSPPVYDALLENLLSGENVEESNNLTIEQDVQSENGI